MDTYFIKNISQDLQDYQEFFIPGFRKKPGILHPLHGGSYLLLAYN